MAAASASEAFDAIGKAMQADATLASKVGGVLQFELGSVSWTVSCTGEGSVAEGRASAPDATITMSEPDFLKLYAGKLTAPRWSTAVLHSLVIEKKIRPMALCAGL
ncbi:hypothetical protein EMIHUDRAFT_222249 [Emiliania huxleyi CCMP1516]|uniref:SCP2 domain-containing protein n=2 Tax=Emiliania huxleyi TaxID=2903 RepID=A0A0D3KYN4_EMIH1|nr:hypothetical protein EMIHUDRAFT_222249 [Emiliania huxleyi CCMP1516]EOD40869.1 hypothetical protein EMIHUDRAFT_222249 [Emiliania huxleyi CCMP1516]|eukprot:XP_005793298.1 hypothetical protein EMIHUDRAFT_222249 [Emiliania huxleyi CCMP1516]